MFIEEMTDCEIVEHAKTHRIPPPSATCELSVKPAVAVITPIESPVMLRDVFAICNVIGGPLAKRTEAWLAKHLPRGRSIKFDQKPGGAIIDRISARNSTCALGLQEVQRFAEEDGIAINQLWFIDYDIAILEPGIWQWLATPGDVVACVPPHCHGHDPFHSGFWRTSPEILKRLGPPWFMDKWTPDGCARLHCDCVGFANKIRAAGLTATGGGTCNHGHGCSWQHT